MTIRSIEQTSEDVYSITPSEGSAFFLRTVYLSLLSAERLSVDYLREGVTFSEEESADILNAALVYSTEKVAMSYLARAEHCRATLEAKLLKKGMEASCVKKALDYLEGRGFLDDERFAGAWLRTRFINHAEGRLRLEAELSARRVRRDAAKNALNEFFLQHTERDICKRAYNKLKKRGVSASEKIAASLSRSGFSLRLIRSVLEEATR